MGSVVVLLNSKGFRVTKIALQRRLHMYLTFNDLEENTYYAGLKIQLPPIQFAEHTEALE